MVNLIIIEEECITEQSRHVQVTILVRHKHIYKENGLPKCHIHQYFLWMYINFLDSPDDTDKSGVQESTHGYQDDEPIRVLVGI